MRYVKLKYSPLARKAKSAVSRLGMPRYFLLSLVLLALAGCCACPDGKRDLHYLGDLDGAAPPLNWASPPSTKDK
jgi:hypothetical protein